jgi:retron-type reverse transcriptase
LNEILRAKALAANLISNDQYGFRTNSNTELAITNFIAKIVHGLTNSQFSCAIFLDLKKAFDSINHVLLLTKTRGNESVQ